MTRTIVLNTNCGTENTKYMYKKNVVIYVQMYVTCQT